MADSTRQFKVTIIPATKPVVQSVPVKDKKLRVAAYCRVSTDSEEQLNSYNAQQAYYTQTIGENENWTFAGVYADAGITGTSMKKRDEFNRMIAACKRGRIDLILTKSISRFSRNTVDCLNTVRMLKSLNIGVLFEKENINTLTESSEFLITLHSSFAQAESESLSKNVSWGIRKSMEAGKVPMHYSTLLGYRKGPDGEPEIVPEEAEVVKQIFRWYINGYSGLQIARELEAHQMRNAKGSAKWSTHTIISILTNEKYMGDAIMQKTYTVDCISKIVRKNTGELPMIYVENHHVPIISRTVFQWVQAEMKRRTSKRKVQQKSAKTERGKYSGKYALTERLVCGECGTPYKRVTWNIRGKKKIVWRCVSRLEFGKDYCHDSPSMEESKLHEAITSAINGFIAERLVQEKEVGYVKLVMTDSTGEGKSLAEMQREVHTIHAEEERLLDLILDDMDNPELNDRMQTLVARKAALMKAIDQTEEDQERQEIDALQMQKLSEWVDEHKAGLQAYDDIATRRVIERITVVSKELIRVKFRDVEETVDATVQK